MNFLEYCKTLKAEDWDKPANSKWTVKDVVAHMVGWEKEVAGILKQEEASQHSPTRSDIEKALKRL